MPCRGDGGCCLLEPLQGSVTIRFAQLLYGGDDLSGPQVELTRLCQRRSKNLIPWRRQFSPVADTWGRPPFRSPRSATLDAATHGVANFDLYRRSGRRVRIVDDSPLSIGGRRRVLAVAKGAPPVPVLGPSRAVPHRPGPFGCSRSCRVREAGETWLIGPSPLNSNGPVIRGERIGLRARHEGDVPVLHSELYDDVPTRSRADSRPWRPIPPGSDHSPFAVTGPSDQAACFSVVELDSQELVGEALLWRIDTHNRTAHIGIALRPRSAAAGSASMSCTRSASTDSP